MVLVLVRDLVDKRLKLLKYNYYIDLIHKWFVHLYVMYDERGTTHVYRCIMCLFIYLFIDDGRW